MFEDADKSLPDFPTLRALIRKTRAIRENVKQSGRQHDEFTEEELQWMFNILATLEHDPSYKLKERMKRCAAEENGDSDV